MTIFCMQCCGERKTAEVQNRAAPVGSPLLPLPDLRPAFTWVPTPQGVVPTCYEHIVVIERSQIIQPGNGAPILRPYS